LINRSHPYTTSLLVLMNNSRADIFLTLLLFKVHYDNDHYNHLMKMLCLLHFCMWYSGKETRGLFFNGCQWRRVFTMLNKLFLCENGLSCNESTVR